MYAYPQLAAATLQLIEKAQVPATLQNAQTVIAINEMLSRIASGDLILQPRGNAA